MTTEHQEQLNRIRLARSKSIGPVTYRKLIQKHGSATNAVNALLDSTAANKMAKVESAERELEAAQKLGCISLFYEPSSYETHENQDTPYPSLLTAIDDSPPVLHTLGNTDLLDNPTLAVVGSRAASAAAMKLTRTIVSELSKAGIVIVSGLARGIDAVAHTSAIHGGTIACLAGGVDSIYPPQNKGLYHQICETGLLVSEMPPGTHATARHFPRRNRIVSGLSLGTLVMEATNRSGSLITARLAGEQGREVFAVPGSPLDNRAEGTNRLLKDGAILTRSADDVLQELEGLMARSKRTSTVKPTYSSPQNRIAREVTMSPLPVLTATSLLDLLTTTPIHIDEIVRLSGSKTDSVLQELQLLELDGKVERHQGGRYSRRS